MLKAWNIKCPWVPNTVCVRISSPTSLPFPSARHKTEHAIIFCQVVQYLVQSAAMQVYNGCFYDLWLFWRSVLSRIL